MKPGSRRVVAPTGSLPLLVTVVGLLGVVLVLVLSRVEPGASAPATPGAAPAPTGVAEAHLTNQGLAVRGVLEPDDPWPRTIVAPATGTLEAFAVAPGDAVATGDPLATIANPELDRQRQALAAALSAVRAELSRRSTGSGNQARDQAEAGEAHDRQAGEIAALEAQYRAAQTVQEAVSTAEATALKALLLWAQATLKRELAAAKRQVRVEDAERAQLTSELQTLSARAASVAAALKARTVVAPVAGWVLERRVQPGEWVFGSLGALGMLGALEPRQAPTPILALYDPRKLRVRVLIPEEHFGRVRRRQSAFIKLESRTTTYAGSVTRILPNADPASGALVVWVALAAPDARCHPGLAAFVTLSAADAPRRAPSEPIGESGAQQNAPSTSEPARGEAPARAPGADNHAPKPPGRP